MRYKPLFAPNDYRKIVTFTQLEELTGIKKTTLRKWVNDGQIPGAFRAGKKRRWQFKREELEEWWRSMHQANEK
jgi:excisionase family DNA binding protein